MRIVNFQERWIPMEHPDVPLTKEQYTALCNGCDSDWEARYATIALGGGWFYTYRSGYLLEKFRYEEGTDDMYHLVEFFYKQKTCGTVGGIPIFVEYAMCEGNYEPSLRDVAIQFIEKLKNQ